MDEENNSLLREEFFYEQVAFFDELDSEALYLEKRLLGFLSLSCLGGVEYNHPSDSKEYR